jgi:hypothetical protein
MVSPATFAVYFGLPLADARDAAFVRVYGLRAVFVALTVAILVIRQEPHLLGSVALAAVVMSAGDAWLTARAQADRRTIARHILISVALVAAGSLLLIA